MEDGLKLKRRLMPPQVHYSERPVADYVTAAVTAATELHRGNTPGDVLVFLTGNQLLCLCSVKNKLIQVGDDPDPFMQFGCLPSCNSFSDLAIGTCRLHDLSLNSPLP